MRVCSFRVRAVHNLAPPGVCRNLKSIVVQIGVEDYFEDPNSPEARKLFDEMVNKLQVIITEL